MKLSHGVNFQNRGEEKNMRVKFYPDDIDSDVITVPDDITEDELSDMACEWVANNVPGFWKVIGEEHEL